MPEIVTKNQKQSLVVTMGINLPTSAPLILVLTGATWQGPSWLKCEKGLCVNLSSLLLAKSDPWWPVNKPANTAAPASK